jgi:hypothetical protein
VVVLANDVGAAILLDFMGLGAVFIGDEPKGAVVFAIGDGHGAGAQILTAGMRDEHGSGEIL